MYISIFLYKQTYTCTKIFIYTIETNTAAQLYIRVSVNECICAHA